MTKRPGCSSLRDQRPRPLARQLRPWRRRAWIFLLTTASASAGQPLRAQADSCAIAWPDGPRFESCEAWESPFGSQAEWLDFMAQAASEQEVEALGRSWSSDEFEGWTSGTRGTVERVTFRSGSLLLRGVLVRPAGEGPFPAVIYARGGNREWGRLLFLDVVRMMTLAESGRVVFALEYRGEGGSEGEPELGGGDVADVRSAAGVLARAPFVDDSRLDIVGLSRGGLVAAWALEEPTPFRSALLVAADLDLLDTAARRPEMDSEVYRLSVPGYAEDRDGALRARSPLHAVDRLADVPLILLHAADDERVHASSSLEFAARWTEAGRRARVVVYESGGHALLGRSPEVRAEIEAWLRRDELEPVPPAVIRGALLAPRYGLSAATDGRWVYVSGGAPSGGRNTDEFSHQGLHASIERVDPVSLQSTYFSNGLQRRANHRTLFVDGVLISCGGRSQHGLERGRTASCERFDIESGLFRELPALTEPLRTLGMAEVDGALYVVGGLAGSGDFSNVTLRLPPGAESWQRLEDLPAPREGEIVAVDGQLWAIGGYNGSTLDSVFVFDTKTGAWDRRQDLPYGLSAFTSVAVDHEIYLFGDYQQMSAVHRYTPATERLERLDLEISPRRHAASVVVDDRVLVLGGNRDRTGMATRLIEAFELEELRAAPLQD